MTEWVPIPSHPITFTTYLPPFMQWACFIYITNVALDDDSIVNSMLSLFYIVVFIVH